MKIPPLVPTLTLSPPFVLGGNVFSRHPPAVGASNENLVMLFLPRRLSRPLPRGSFLPCTYLSLALIFFFTASVKRTHRFRLTPGFS